jgi:hypothetical protein
MTDAQFTTYVDGKVIVMNDSHTFHSGSSLTDDIDLLIIDQIGKNISGNGHDPNVTGRNITRSFKGVLELKKLFIRGLTEETHHNACGLSECDVTTRRVLNTHNYSNRKIQKTYKY